MEPTSQSTGTNPTNVSNPVVEGQPAPVQPRKKSPLKKVFIISGIIIFILFVVPFIIGLILLSKSGTPNTPTTALFYDTLANTAQKTKVRLAHYEISYNSASDQQANKDADQLQSLAEIDLSTKTFSAAYARQDPVGADNGRCVKNQEYEIGGYKLYDTLAAAKDALVSRPETPIPTPKIYATCGYTDPLRYTKLTDGVIPMGFSAAQTTSWVDYLKKAGVFVLKDEGSATYKGQTGRKISFTLGKNGSTQITTDYLFYAQRDGTTGQTLGNNKDMSLFDRILDPANGTNLKGFYIIDEKSKVPIYSEMEAVAVPGDDFRPLSTKQHYSYPSALTMTTTTPLEDL